MYLRGNIERCAPVDAEISAPRFERALDAWASESVVSRTGARRTVYAARSGEKAELFARDESGRGTPALAGGAQVAVADLDLDGNPELVTSNDTLDAQADALLVRTWQPDGNLAERWRIPVPAGIRALAVCPPERHGPRAIVLATPSEVWIIR